MLVPARNFQRDASMGAHMTVALGLVLLCLGRRAAPAS
jgi:hypothetical protein